MRAPARIASSEWFETSGFKMLGNCSQRMTARQRIRIKDSLPIRLPRLLLRGDGPLLLPHPLSSLQHATACASVGLAFFAMKSVWQRIERATDKTFGSPSVVHTIRWASLCPPASFHFSAVSPSLRQGRLRALRFSVSLFAQSEHGFLCCWEIFGSDLSFFQERTRFGIRFPEVVTARFALRAKSKLEPTCPNSAKQTSIPNLVHTPVEFPFRTPRLRHAFKR